MLLHIVPRFFADAVRPADVALADLTIEAFGLVLRDGKELMTGRPYPNKYYVIGCRRSARRKAMDGILIDTGDMPVTEFETVARWAVGCELLFTHRVTYKLLDQDFDAASDDMVLWSGMSPGLGDWQSRMPAWARDVAPCNAEPKMQQKTKHKPAIETIDLMSPQVNYWIGERRQVFCMPTIERERLLTCPVRDRIPGLESAFVVTVDLRDRIGPRGSQQNAEAARKALDMRER